MIINAALIGRTMFRSSLCPLRINSGESKLWVVNAGLKRTRVSIAFLTADGSRRSPRASLEAGLVAAAARLDELAASVALRTSLVEPIFGGYACLSNRSIP